MKNSTNKIEDNGINIFITNFLFDCETIQPDISKNDRSPCWDGNLYLYYKNTTGWIKENIEEKIPVQVKASKRDWKEPETYPFLISDIKRYYNDGGVVIIRPIYKNPSEYRIYAKMLLPIDLKKYLNVKSKTKSIELKHYKKPADFEIMLRHFIKNKTMQYSFKPNLLLDKETGKIDNVHIAAIGSNPINALMEGDVYYYTQRSENIFEPIDFDYKKFQFENNVKIRINKKIYFNNIYPTIEKGTKKSFFLVINTALKIHSNNGVIITLNNNPDTLITDYLTAYDFLLDVAKNNGFHIADIFLPLEKTDNNIDESYIESLKRIMLFADKIRTNTKNLTFSNINQHFNNLIKYIDVISNNKSLLLNGDYGPSTIKQTEILNRSIITIFTKVNKEYKIELFYDLPDFDIHIRDEKNPKKCSRYIIFAYEDNFTNIQCLEGFEKEIINDIKRYYVPEHHNHYNQLALRLLKTFDCNGRKEFLTLSKKILLHINAFQLDDYTKIVNYINLAQIDKRLGILSENTINELLKLKKNSDNLNALCCINLIIDSKIEFKNLFNKLTKEEQIEFKKWPIYNLF